MGVPRLYDLQQVDSAIVRLVAHRASLSNGAAEGATVVDATGRLEEIREQLAAHRGRLRALDMEVQSLQGKRAKVERDLYSGRVGNPKELSAMQADIAMLDGTRGRLEDEMLGLLEAVEQLEQQERDGVRALDAANAALAAQVAAYEKAADADDREIAALTARRATLAEGLEEEFIRRYDRLRERKGGVAIVAVRGGICEGCHTVVPERVQRRLEDDPDTLAACDGCGRLLFVPPRA